MKKEKRVKILVNISIEGEKKVVFDNDYINLLFILKLRVKLVQNINYALQLPPGPPNWRLNPYGSFCSS